MGRMVPVVVALVLAEEESRLADVVVRPDLSRVHATDLAARGRAIAAGEEAARAALPEIRRLLERKGAAQAGYGSTPILRSKE